MPFLLEILGNTCIVVICWPVYDVINFEIDHNCLIRPTFNITKKSGSKCKYLRTKPAFNSLSANFTKWSNTLKQFVGNLPTNCLSVFVHFVGLVLKGLTSNKTVSDPRVVFIKLSLVNSIILASKIVFRVSNKHTDIYIISWTSYGRLIYLQYIYRP